MSARFSKSLVMSVLMHGALGGLMCWVMLRTEPPPADVRPTQVMVVSPTSSAPGTPSAGSSPPSIAFKPLPVPPPRVPEAVAEEEVAPTPIPTPPPSRPKPVTPKVTPTTPVVAKPTAKPTSIETFRKQHPAPAQPSIGSGASRPATTVSPQISMATVLGESATPRASTGAGTGSTPVVHGDGGGETSAAYLERLFAKLRTAHQKPEGLDDGLQTRVEFVVRADGTVSGVRILKTSGNTEFDASVLAAFRQVSGLGAPPASVVGVNAVTFRTRAE